MKSRHFHIIILVVLVLSSFLFRFTNLNWDSGNRIHPDEALIVNSAQSILWFDNLNPKFHDYNGFSVYLLSAASILTSQTSIEDITIVGRYISASISVISVLFFYLLMIKLFPPTIALYSTAVFSFSPLLIQLAHFYTTDSILVFLLILLLYRMNTYTKKPSIKNLVFLSIPLGLSIATKNTGYFFLPLPILTIMIQKNRNKYFFLVLLALLVLLSFFFASPYSFLDFSGYLSRSRYLSDVVSGKLSFDWTVQFQQTTPLYWFIQTLWAFGPLAILGPLGIGWMMKKNKPIALWTFGFIIFLLLTYLKFIRYNAPLTPLYALGFGYLFLKLHKNSIGSLALIILLFMQILYGMMFFSIYTTKHTSLQATDWIAKNIPKNATILREEWNNIIRYEKEPLMGKNFTIDSVNFYTPDKKDKVDTIIKKLLATDYIILDSPKVRNTTRRLQDTYPHTSMFYKLLENGALGFVHVVEFTDYPRIGSIKINDEGAEETFTIFDHPTVRIYQKQRQLTEKEISILLTSDIQ